MGDHAPVGGEEGIDVAGDEHLPNGVAGFVRCRKRILEWVAHFFPAFKFFS